MHIDMHIRINSVPQKGGGGDGTCFLPHHNWKTFVFPSKSSPVFAPPQHPVQQDRVFCVCFVFFHRFFTDACPRHSTLFNGAVFVVCVFCVFFVFFHRFFADACPHTTARCSTGPCFLCVFVFFFSQQVSTGVCPHTTARCSTGPWWLRRVGGGAGGRRSRSWPPRASTQQR